MELSDYFGMKADAGKAEAGPCYGLTSALDLSKAEVVKECEQGLGTLLDRLLLLNPDFATVTQLTLRCGSTSALPGTQLPLGFMWADCVCQC